MSHADSSAFPTEAPNVTIANPTIRRRVRYVIDTIGGLAFIAAAVDAANPDFDFFTTSASIFAGYTAARVVFGFAVDSPNTPKEQ